MSIELGAPSYLALAAIRIDGEPCLFGITLRHPQIHLRARPYTGLRVTGARADLAHAQATRFYTHHDLPPAADLAIELAIPSAMGLSSSPMQGLAVARALAALHGLPTAVDDLGHAVGLGADDASALHAFAGGGLLAVDHAGGLRRRAVIMHADERRDWVFVLVFPRVGPGDADSAESRRLAALWRAVPPPPGDPGADTLWTAVERDDIGAFAAALAEVEALNQAALAESGQPAALTDAEQAILAVMRANGALHCGRAPTGRALYALIEGAGPSRVMRAALTRHLGYLGGAVMATICDPAGVRQ